MMESDNMETPPSGESSPANHRWNPTKEQIRLLENLYKQGVRTPSAEQIQEITTRLQVYGHIEGKNVFYWFQNHKARQRQKQKQEDHSNMATFFNRFVHHHQPSVSPFHSPPLSPNVICSPYFLPQSEIAFYPQCPKLLLPTNRKRAPSVENIDKTNPMNDLGGVPGQLGLHATPLPTKGSSNIVVQETLPLFPLHPTGFLQEKTSTLSLGSNSSEKTSIVISPSGSLDTTPSCISSFNEHVDAGAASHLFFDFFTGKGST